MYRYWLSNFRLLSPAKILLLLENYGSAEGVYFSGDYKKNWPWGLTEADIEKLENHKKNWDLLGEWEKFLETGISFLTIEDAAYPERLRYLTDPPYAIFYKGNLPKEEKTSVAIVGARTRSAYGEAAARNLGKSLGAYDIEVISGLARGIDSDGHKGALEGGAKTYGVLGCGVDVIYPAGNRYLYEKIIENGGGILSEFPLQTPPIRRNFPQRNRIISGLSDCIVVIEAKEKSGSLITADYALEQGKEIYAMPGRCNEPLSAGTNRLIQQGCGVFLSPEDLISDLGICKLAIKGKKEAPKKSLENEEGLLYSLIDFTPTGLGSLLEQTGFSLGQLLTVIDKLKEKGLVKEPSANYFVRKVI